jgi:S-formylglutathione hydrolase FrmB
MIKRLRLGEAHSTELYGKLKGDTLPETWRENSILDLAAKLPLSQLNSIKYFIDCGDKDERIYGVSLLNFTLNDRKIPHEFRVREGNHTWAYWRQSIEDGMKFLSPLFRR